MKVIVVLKRLGKKNQKQTKLITSALQDVASQVAKGGTSSIGLMLETKQT